MTPMHANLQHVIVTDAQRPEVELTDHGGGMYGLTIRGGGGNYCLSGDPAQLLAVISDIQNVVLGIAERDPEVAA